MTSQQLSKKKQTAKQIASRCRAADVPVPTWVRVILRIGKWF